MIVATAQDAADLFGPHFEGAEEERIAVMHLDSGRRLLALDRLTGPSAVDEVELPLRAIVKAALDRNAAGLIVAHNHPSGNPHPSRADIDATRRLADAAGFFDIRLHDHFIFAGKECRSFRELRLI